MKVCTRCGEVKPFNGFRVDFRYKDGRVSWCKECKNAHKREWRKRRREEMPAQVCPTCRLEFRPHPEKVQTYCSNSCRGYGVKRSGGRYLDSNGYISVYVGRGHPIAHPSRPYALEHRLVMSEMLGRWLLSSEVVHHINGVKDDNRPENLHLFSSNAAHSRFHRSCAA